jgi:hypothetical protein
MHGKGYNLVPQPAVEPPSFLQRLVQWIRDMARFLSGFLFWRQSHKPSVSTSPVTSKCICTQRFNAQERYTADQRLLCPVHGWKSTPTPLIKRGHVVSLC